MGGCAWMLVGKVERLVSEAKSNYMHKARAAGRNYHKDRAGIEDTRAREVLFRLSTRKTFELLTFPLCPQTKDTIAEKCFLPPLKDQEVDAKMQDDSMCSSINEDQGSTVQKRSDTSGDRYSKKNVCKISSSRRSKKFERTSSFCSSLNSHLIEDSYLESLRQRHLYEKEMTVRYTGERTATGTSCLGEFRNYSTLFDVSSTRRFDLPGTPSCVKVVSPGEPYRPSLSVEKEFSGLRDQEPGAVHFVFASDFMNG
ncbi:hypothetical protein K0M31_002992 [Melipona bicolor]|uniref:Uncharacterized protein n=1 Tax=Melipona bicolor TaxID=60889 RepID=A0AA40KQ53_9HYME|nr:hypothetical protein K0M31_002992 [Melipona bicolor]